MGSINIAVIAISDTRTPETDGSGNRLAELASEVGSVVERKIVPDDREVIAEILRNICDSGEFDLVLTTGGTGLAPRDVTPEATLDVIEREVPGIAEAMRRETGKFTNFAMISRSVCGVKGETMIINFPGSPKAVEQCFEVVRPALKHVVQQIKGFSHDDN